MTIRVAGQFTTPGLPIFGSIAEEIIALSELKYWVQADPEYGATVTEGKISALVSQKSSSVSFTQATDTRRPAYEENGIASQFSVMTFDGIDDRLVGSVNEDWTQACSFLAIAKQTGSPATDVIFGGSSSGTGTDCFLSFTSTGAVNLSVGNRAVTVPARTMGLFNFAVCSHDGNGTLRILSNSVYSETTGGNNVAPSNAPALIGALNTTGANFLTGSIADIMKFDGDIFEDSAIISLLKDFADFTYGLK